VSYANTLSGVPVRHSRFVDVGCGLWMAYSPHDARVSSPLRMPCAAPVILTLDVIVGDDAGAADFRGPYVQGTRGARFFYLSWGQIGEDGAFAMFARVKLPLPALDADALARLKTGDTPLTALVELSDARGRPVTASLRAPQLVWEC